MKNPLRVFASLRERRTQLTRVADDPGWSMLSGLQSGASNERDYSDSQQLYLDSLTAWRKNPMAKRFVDLTSDFVLGDGLTPTAPGMMGRFIKKFWAHPKNALDLRLPDLVDELSRAGDLFVTLHRNPADGMSYVRAIPKDRIIAIETLPNDYETEVSYTETRGAGELVTWPAPSQFPNSLIPDSPPAVMLHFKINAVVGAILGEGDLTTMIPWMQRYSRMLEDRVRLNWALKAFLWIVTVPSSVVNAKKEQYNTPPEGGSVIVKDSQETWESVTPNLHAFDAQWDLRAVRQFIDAGAGVPPHWRGEATDINLATATAMERATTRHLRRRQLYVRNLAIELCHTAYTRAWELGKVSAHPNRDLITCETTDITRQDNRDLANAAFALAQAFEVISRATGTGPEFNREALRLLFSFAGEPIPAEDLDKIVAGLTPPPAFVSGKNTPQTQPPGNQDTPPAGQGTQPGTK